MTVYLLGFGSLLTNRLQLTQRVERRTNDLGFLAMPLQTADQIVGLAKGVSQGCLQLFRRIEQFFRRAWCC